MGLASQFDLKNLLFIQLISDHKRVERTEALLQCKNPGKINVEYIFTQSGKK